MIDYAITPMTADVKIDGQVVVVSSLGIDTSNFFQTINKFSELDTEQKKIDARQNLGVQVFDCGEFF